MGINRACHGCCRICSEKDKCPSDSPFGPDQQDEAVRKIKGQQIYISTPAYSIFDCKPNEG